MIVELLAEGVGVAVEDGDEVEVDEGLEVAVEVDEGLDVAVEVAVSVEVEVADALLLAVEVAVSELLAVVVPVDDGDPVLDGEGVDVGVFDDEPVEVPLPVGVGVLD